MTDREMTKVNVSNTSTQQHALPAMRMLKAISLLVYCVVSAAAPDTGVELTGGEPEVEKIVVKGTNFCGTWPIEHQRILGCEYAKLEKEDLPKLLEMRPNFVSTCLSCQGNRCRAVQWPDGEMLARVICRRLFWTPKKVRSMFFYSEHSGPLRVFFTFKIPTAGRVEAIKLVSYTGDISRDELLELIEKGARRARYEPLVIADEAYEIIDLYGRYIL